MTRLSRYFLPTEKEAPADAEALSHRLMVRAGLIRQLGAGMWTWLPAGWRVHENVAQIVREELDRIGSHEMLMPVLNPAELWQRSGRYGIDELFKLKDRRGADLVLAMTHEEAITTHVAPVVRSYRDLPLFLYHIQTKERDEPRPRAGVLRTREFIMKDAYTFDRDREALDESYETHREAYDRIFDRVGLEWYRVESDVGMMGGVGAHEYMAPCPAGENDVALAPGYAANVEVASAEAQPVELPDGLPAPELVETPGLTTVREVADRMDVPAGALLKAFPVIVEDRGLVMVVVRGDHRVNEIKLANALGAPFRPAREDDFADRIGPAGYIGPVGIDVPDPARRGGRARLVHHGREPRQRPPAWRRARPRLPVQARRRAAGRAGRHRGRAPDPDRAGDRGRQHLQARHPLLRAAERDLSRRVGQPAPDLDGLLRHRAGADHGRRGRAVRRRGGDLVAAGDRAVRHPPGRARQGGQRGAPGSPRSSTTTSRRPACACSTTTATPGRGRSSPMPSCWGCRCG